MERISENPCNISMILAVPALLEDSQTAKDFKAFNNLLIDYMDGIKDFSLLYSCHLQVYLLKLPLTPDVGAVQIASWGN